MARRGRQARQQAAEDGNGESGLPVRGDEHLDISALETWLWDAACAIRGATDAPKFKDFILPLIFFKRLSDVFEDEFAAHVKEYGDEQLARSIIEADLAHALKSGSTPIIRFYVPGNFSWRAVRNHGADGRLGEFLTGALREVARLNPDLQGVLDIKDYNERQSGQRTLDDDRLASLIEILSRHRLGLANTEPDILGRAYEYLLRKFAEGQGQSAGEFYTPKEVGELIAELIDPEPFSTIYDPACGSGGLLIKARLLYERRHPEEKSRSPQLWGQELNPVTFAMAKMNMFLHDYTDSSFAIGDTFRKPGFGPEGTLLPFDYVVANPMWNQDNYDDAFYDNDSYNRFNFGIPPKSSADWGWVQHMYACLKEGGRAAVVLDTGAVSRGSGSRSSNKEKAIRQAMVEADGGGAFAGEPLLQHHRSGNHIAATEGQAGGEARADAAGQRLPLLRQGEAQECSHRGGNQIGGGCLPQMGDAGEAVPGDHFGGSQGGGLQPQPLPVRGGQRAGGAPAHSRDTDGPGGGEGGAGACGWGAGRSA